MDQQGRPRLESRDAQQRLLRSRRQVAPGQQVLQQVAADTVAVGYLALLRLEIGLRGDGAAHLDELHDIADDGQRRLPRLRVVTRRGEHALPQGHLPHPERAQEVGQRDALPHPAERLVAGGREVSRLGRPALDEARQQHPEDRLEMHGDALPQPGVRALPVGRHLLPDRRHR